MSIQVYAPDGEVGQAARELAASVDSLSGLKLTILDNGKPNADVLMCQIAERLALRTGVELLGVRRKQTAATPCEVDLFAEITDTSDLVLTGSAD